MELSYLSSEKWMETSQPLSRALASPPCYLGSDTPVKSPHLSWRTGGLQGMETNELPSSVISANVTATLL